MAWAYVRDTGKIVTDNTAGGSSGSFGVLPVVGNYLVGTNSTYSNGAAHAVTITDNQTTNTWTSERAAASESDGGQRATVSDAKVDASAGTFTVTVSASGGAVVKYYSWCCAEFSGQAASPFDASGATSNQAAGTSVTATTSGNLAENDELAVSACSVDSTVNHTSITASGYSAMFNEPDASAHVAGGGAYKILSGGSGATTNAAWSWTTASGFKTCAAIATYKTTGAAATRPVKMAGAWNGYAGESGGFVG